MLEERNEFDVTCLTLSCEGTRTAGAVLYLKDVDIVRGIETGLERFFSLRWAFDVFQ